MCPLHFPPKTKLVLGSWEEGFPSCISRCAMSIVNGHFLQVLQISVHDAAKLICVSFLEVMLQVDPAPVSKLSMFFFFPFFPVYNAVFTMFTCRLPGLRAVPFDLPGTEFLWTFPENRKRKELLSTVFFVEHALLQITSSKRFSARLVMKGTTQVG